jgi:hypothetical protein
MTSNEARRGSPRQTATRGPGPVAGAGEVAAGGPGALAERVRTEMAGAPEAPASGREPVVSAESEE